MNIFSILSDGELFYNHDQMSPIALYSRTPIKAKLRLFNAEEESVDNNNNNNSNTLPESPPPPPPPYSPEDSDLGKDHENSLTALDENEDLATSTQYEENDIDSVIRKSLANVLNVKNDDDDDVVFIYIYI